MLSHRKIAMVTFLEINTASRCWYSNPHYQQMSTSIEKKKSNKT
jgi:hypothetical protein